MNFEKIPLYWVNRLSALSRRELAGRFRAAGHDISAEEWAILLLLWREDGQSPGAMSQRTVRDPTTMTRLIDGMVRKGLVTRQADRQDRRRSLIHLSPRGQALERDLVDLARPMIERATEGISAVDLGVAVDVLARMVANLSQERATERK